VDDLAAAHTAIAKLEVLLPTLDYGADGVAVKVDKRALYAELGTIGNREPRWAVARKFAPEVQITRLRKIEINVGRTGTLNPYAVLEPVEIGGVTVSTATLHNFELIKAKDIREEDDVEVTRAGEVIPQVLGPVKKKGRRKAAYQPPERCPVCGSAVERPVDEVAIFCPNVSCPARIFEGIVHFASRSAMDIRGLGYERVRALLDFHLIENVADLYDTSKVSGMRLLTIEGFAEKSADQLLKAIEASKRRPLSTVLFALGIRHVGAQGAKLLARHFGTMTNLRKATEEQIGNVRGVGPAIAAAVAGFFSEKRNIDLVERLISFGVTTREPSEATVHGPMEGQTYVITGTLPKLSRPEITAIIEAAGGHVTDNVSKTTTAVIVGADPGSKLEKARSLGIDTITEEQLLRRANRKP